MSLNSAMIYRRTDRGVREVYEKSHQFTQSERLILILLDGRLNVAGLQAPAAQSQRRAHRARDRQAAGRRPGRADGFDGRLKSPSRAEPEVMRLEPDVVAQFLEQTDSIPITVVGATRGRGGRRTGPGQRGACRGPTGARSSREPAKVRPTSIRNALQTLSADSVRSHYASSPSSFATDEWDPTEATQLRNHDRERARPTRPAGRARSGRDGRVHRAAPAGRIAVPG